MGKNHLGAVPAEILKVEMPALSNDVDFVPGAEAWTRPSAPAG